MTTARWGLLALVAIAVADIVLPDEIVLLPALSIAPLIVASDGPSRSTFLVGLGAIVVAVVSGSVNDLHLATHLIGILVVVVVSLIAWRRAIVRSNREAALRNSRPHVERSLRLASAMAAGEMGEWWFDEQSGVARWDASAARLLGLDPEPGEGPLDVMLAHVAADDLDVLARTVEASQIARRGFRADHRVCWPTDDGRAEQQHWVEVVGEPLLTERHEVAGFVGLVQSIDERRREVEERDRLLQLEAAARRRAEFLDRMNDVLARSIDVEEIVDHLTGTVVPDLADWAVLVLTIDRSDRAPLVVAHHRDPERDRALGERVARNGEVASVIGSVGPPDPAADRAASFQVIGSGAVPGRLRNWAEPFGLGSVVGVPVLGPLGVLGILYLVREVDRPPASAAEFGLAEELASRAGAALNAAVLHERLSRSRALLQALQVVTGELAGAVTFDDVTRAILGEGRAAMRATGAALFVVDRLGHLHVQAADGVHEVSQLEDLARCAVRESMPVDGAIAGPSGDSADCSMAVAVPLTGLAGPIGVLAFLFEEGRTLTSDELAMLATLGSRAAAAVERAATYDRDHDVALVLQRRLLPDLSQVPTWLAVAADYEPATGGPIGGDWYQLVGVGDGRVAVVVGDAVGHGLVSAAAMGQLRASVTTALTATHDPATALEIVDRFAELSHDTVGASLGVALLHESGTVRISSAGHPPFMLVPRGQPIRVIEGGRRPLLGYGQGSPAVTEFEHLGVGDTLVLYSDGLIERRRRSFDAGLAELAAILDDLRDVDVEVICREVIARMSVRADAEDDVAVMVVRRIADA